MATKKARQPATILHERENLRHRIVTLAEGQVVTGPWTSNDKLAELNGWFANNGASNQLPYGIFRVVQLPQQTLVE